MASDRNILCASGVEAAVFLGVGALLGFLPLYPRNIAGLGDAYVGVLIWVPLVMAMAGKPLAGRISDRIGRKPIILFGLALCPAMRTIARSRDEATRGTVGRVTISDTAQ